MPDKFDTKGWIAILITVLWGAVTIINGNSSSFQAAEITDVKTAVSLNAKELKETQASVVELKTQMRYVIEGHNEIKSILKGIRYVQAK